MRRSDRTEEGQRRDLERPPLPEPLPSPVVDTHCHLDVADGHSAFSPEDAIAAATAVGVERIVQVGCDVDSSRWAVEAARRWPQVVATVAIHPNDAARLGSGLDAAVTEIDRFAQLPGVRGVGETGLDYYRTRDPADQARQRQSFAAHIDIARRYDKTLVIHDRDAHDDVLDVLDADGAPERIVMHCFSGDAAFARRCLDRGGYLSFAGTVTFTNAAALREALTVTPLDRVLVETDAPYLTPVPFRGRPNASYLVPHTVRAVAATLAADLEAVCEALARNADAAFGGAWS